MTSFENILSDYPDDGPTRFYLALQAVPGWSATA
jgi:hypothetical protein